MDSCRGPGKRVRSRSPSSASSPPPPREKRSRARSRSHSRSRSGSPSRSGRSSPTSSQFSDQSEDETPPHRDEETLDLGIPSLGNRSALDHELLTTEDKLDQTPTAAPDPTPGTSTAPPLVYTRLGPPTDTSADTAREPVRSWRESWESPDFRFSRPVEFVPVIQALAKVLNFKPPAPTSIQNVGDLFRFKRRLLSRGRDQIPPLCLQRQSLRVRPRKARRVEGTPPLLPISPVTRKVPVVAVAKAEEAAPRKTPTPRTTPPSHPPLNPMLNARPGPVGCRLRSFAHLWLLVTSDKFVLETVSRGYRIKFTAKPPTTSRVWWTETRKNLSRREDLERGLQSMMDKQCIREIPVSPETPRFYSPIFLVAKESGGWRPILNLKFVVPLRRPFRPRFG